MFVIECDECEDIADSVSAFSANCSSDEKFPFNELFHS